MNLIFWVYKKKYINQCYYDRLQIQTNGKITTISLHGSFFFSPYSNPIVIINYFIYKSSLHGQLLSISSIKICIFVQLSQYKFSFYKKKIS